MKWEDAASATMMQLKGQDIVVPPNPSTYPWMNLAYSFAGLKMEDSNVIALEDPKAVQLRSPAASKLRRPVARFRSPTPEASRMEDADEHRPDG